VEPRDGWTVVAVLRDGEMGPLYRCAFAEEANSWAARHTGLVSFYGKALGVESVDIVWEGEV
jgi:hypothetical protein